MILETTLEETDGAHRLAQTFAQFFGNLNMIQMNYITNSEMANLSSHSVSMSHLVHQHRDRHKEPNMFDPSMFGF